MKTTSHLVALALLLLTLLGFFVFPGHTWLQSDTQIYTPILERMADPSLFGREMVALRPHVTWTIYDETAVGLRRLTGLSFETILQGEQIVTRIAGLTGVYLLATSLGLAWPGALLAAACFGLGATINGPAVLTMEYEPVPRGFAIMLILGALGCLSAGRCRTAAILACIATLYHPTTTAPFWLCVIMWWFLSGDDRPRLKPVLLAMAASAGLVLLFALLQHGETERQPLLGRIGPALERIQRLRGAYNWIDLWPSDWFWQYPLLMTYVVLAWRRLRPHMSTLLSFFTLALPLCGLVAVPVQYMLLDVGKWILIPQFQPARAVLFITAMACLLGVSAGWHAARASRWLESAAWFLVVFAIPANSLVFELFTGANWVRLALVVMFAALAILTARWPAVLAAAVLAPVLLIPTAGGLTNYPALHTRELDELAAWARTNTGKDDLFLFPDIHRGLQAGVFRATSLRALYVDWKGGGQANLLPGLGEEWWRRWQAVRTAKPPLLPVEEYRGLGIDYLVLRPANRPAGVAPVFANKDWIVLSLAARGL